MNILPTSRSSGSGTRLSSENIAVTTTATAKATTTTTSRISDKDLYLEMMNEVMGVTAASSQEEGRIQMDILTSEDPLDRRRRLRVVQQQTQASISSCVTKTNTLQSFFDREKHDRSKQQFHNSFASDEVQLCDKTEENVDDDDDDDNDEDEFYEDDDYYDDDDDTKSSMKKPFLPFDDEPLKQPIISPRKSKGPFWLSSLSTPSSTTTTIKPKYNHRNRINAKQMDQLSTSLHTSDGTEVTCTETEYMSLNGSSHHSSSPYATGTMRSDTHYMQPALKFPPLPVTVYDEDATVTGKHNIPDILALQTHHMLGEGFFGKVYLVSVPGTGNTNNDHDEHKNHILYYAMKKLSKYHLICEDQVHTAVREKNVLQLCSHPNIATFYGANQDASYLYLLQSYIPGGDLFHLTHHWNHSSDSTDPDRKHINYEYHHPILSDECNVQFYVACITDALWYMHCGGFSSPTIGNATKSLSIVYRDLKPENIMINERGYPILIDFGYSKIVEGSKKSNEDDDDDDNGNMITVQSSTLTKTYTMCGTPKYISPEIIEGIGHTCSTDYWSLGIVVYELLTCGREHPFEFTTNTDDFSLYRNIVEADFIPLPDEISVDGTDFVDQLLQKDPNVRLGTTESRTYNPILLHPWLRQWDVSLLRQQSYLAPWIPTVQQNPLLNRTTNTVIQHDQNDDDNGSNVDDEQSLTFDMDQQNDPNLTMKEQAKFVGF